MSCSNSPSSLERGGGTDVRRVAIPAGMGRALGTAWHHLLSGKGGGVMVVWHHLSSGKGGGVMVVWLQWCLDGAEWVMIGASGE